jgi:carbamate kinase
MYDPSRERTLVGVEAVIDKDLASALLARELGADVYIMATDVDGVYEGWGTPDQRRLPELKADDATTRGFAAGSMGPKVEAAAEFATQTGKRAAIGSLDQIDGLVAGTAGTSVVA